MSLCLTSRKQLRSYRDGTTTHLTDRRSRLSDSGYIGTRRVIYTLHHIVPCKILVEAKQLLLNV